MLNAKRGLTFLQNLQEKQLHSQYIDCELQNAMMLISSLWQKRVQLFFQASAPRWYGKGDTMSKNIFQHVMPKRNKIVASYYGWLLSVDIPSAETLQMRQKVWISIAVKVHIFSLHIGIGLLMIYLQH